MPSPVIGLIFRRAIPRSHAYYSHVGLGVNAFHTTKVLRANGYQAYALKADTLQEVQRVLTTQPFTHVVIEAIWLKKAELVTLIEAHPDIQFFVRAHSNVGFLQAEPGAIQGIRDALDLQNSELNLQFASNSKDLKRFLEGTYNEECTLLENLYYLERVAPRPHLPFPGGIPNARPLRVSSFGALRQLKMHVSAASGALLLAERNGWQLEFHVSVCREEHGSGVLASLRYLFNGLPWATLIEDPWRGWGEFRRLVAFMDLGIQVSASETFNITTADAVAERVPCIVSTAIDWLPARFQVEIDAPDQIARAGAILLQDATAPQEQFNALQAFQTEALNSWKAVLGAP